MSDIGTGWDDGELEHCEVKRVTNIKRGSFRLFTIKKVIRGQIEPSHRTQVVPEQSCFGPSCRL